MTHQELPPQTVERRGEAIFEESIRPRLGDSGHGLYVTIDIDTGDYVIGDDWTIQPGQLHAKRPHATLYTLRVGYPSVSSIGTASGEVSGA